MLFPVVFCVFAVTGISTGLTESGWREASVELNWKITKFLNENNLEQYYELFSTNSEEVWPGFPVGGNNDVLEEESYVIQEDQIQHRYNAFVDLLYWSPDVAVIRHTSYIHGKDEDKIQLHGVFVLIEAEKRVRIRLSVYNFQ